MAPPSGVTEAGSPFPQGRTFRHLLRKRSCLPLVFFSGASSRGPFSSLVCSLLAPPPVYASLAGVVGWDGAGLAEPKAALLTHSCPAWGLFTPSVCTHMQVTRPEIELWVSRKPEGFIYCCSHQLNLLQKKGRFEAGSLSAATKIFEQRSNKHLFQRSHHPALPRDNNEHSKGSW